MIILLVPSLLLLFLVFGIPFFRYIWLSLHSFSVSTSLIPINNNGANWIRLINDERFWQDVIQTARFAILSVSLEIIIALCIALLLNQSWKGKGLIRAITLLPWALPTTIMALGWRWIFNNPYGPIEQFLSLVNLSELNILSSPYLTWIATVVADVWKTTPFVALILLAGLQTIPNDLYEALYIEGGNARDALLKITIPLLKPYLFISMIFRFSQAFGVFDLIQVMTGGGPAGSTESLALYAYLNAMRFLDFGYSSTIVIGSFIILVVICITSWIILKQTIYLVKQ